jgi:hypothetical protein
MPLTQDIVISDVRWILPETVTYPERDCGTLENRFSNSLFRKDMYQHNVIHPVMAGKEADLFKVRTGKPVAGEHALPRSLEILFSWNRI